MHDHTLQHVARLQVYGKSRGDVSVTADLSIFADQHAGIGQRPAIDLAVK